MHGRYATESASPVGEFRTGLTVTTARGNVRRIHLAVLPLSQFGQTATAPDAEHEGVRFLDHRAPGQDTDRTASVCDDRPLSTRLADEPEIAEPVRCSRRWSHACQEAHSRQITRAAVADGRRETTGSQGQPVSALAV